MPACQQLQRGERGLARPAVLTIGDIGDMFTVPGGQLFVRMS